MNRLGFLGALSSAGVASAATSGAPRAAETTSSDRSPIYALVLSGGTAHGAYEAGVISALRTLPYDYQLVCGTSIGALNGAMFASGQAAALLDLWQHIAQRTVIALPSDVAPNASTAVLARVWALPHRILQAGLGKVQGIYSGKPPLDIISDILLTADRRSVKPFAMPLFWSATDLMTGCSGYFLHDGEERLRASAAGYTQALGSKGLRLDVIHPGDPWRFAHALRASSAIPAFFEPELLDELFLVDGGVLNNTPFGLAKLAADTFSPRRPIEIHAVLLNSAHQQPLTTKDRANGLQILLSCYNLMAQRILDDAARLAVREGQDARALIARTPNTADISADVARSARVTIKYISPSMPLVGSAFDFKDTAAIDANIRLGADDLQRLGWRDYVLSKDQYCSFGSAVTAE